MRVLGEVPRLLGRFNRYSPAISLAVHRSNAHAWSWQAPDGLRGDDAFAVADRAWLAPAEAATVPRMSGRADAGSAVAVIEADDVVELGRGCLGRVFYVETALRPWFRRVQLMSCPGRSSR